jgi:hypothetical protein
VGSFKDRSSAHPFASFVSWLDAQESAPARRGGGAPLLVDDEVDHGPIVLQTVRVEDDDTVAIARILEEEHVVPKHSPCSPKGDSRCRVRVRLRPEP